MEITNYQNDFKSRALFFFPLLDFLNVFLFISKDAAVTPTAVQLARTFLLNWASCLRIYPPPALRSMYSVLCVCITHMSNTRCARAHTTVTRWIMLYPQRSHVHLLNTTFKKCSCLVIYSEYSFLNIDFSYHDCTYNISIIYIRSHIECNKNI